jgi:hypothetical protein
MASFQKYNAAVMVVVTCLAPTWWMVGVAIFSVAVALLWSECPV